MAGSTRETDELSIQVAILEAMQDGRIWSNADLKEKLSDALPWTAEERSASPSRPREFLWENRVNNALSPSRASSLYAKRFVEKVGRGEHRITAKGLSFINDEDFSVDDLLNGV